MKLQNRCYEKDPNIVSRRIADEFILVPIRHNVGDLESIYTLNEVAARIWELIDGKRNTEEIRNIIIQEFQVSPEEAEQDLSEFIEKLERIEGIRPA